MEKKKLVTALVMAALSGMAFGIPMAFESLDLNKDGALSKDEVASAPDVALSFDKADADKDGKLSQTEYDAFTSNQSGTQQAATIPPSGAGQSSTLPPFESLDINNDGMIIKSEYDAAGAKMRNGGEGMQGSNGGLAQSSAQGAQSSAPGAQTSTVRTQAFQSLDTNGDGFLTQVEVEGMRTLADPVKFARVDVDKDGKLNVSEYINAATASPEDTGHGTRGDQGMRGTPPSQETGSGQTFKGGQF